MERKRRLLLSAFANSIVYPRGTLDAVSGQPSQNRLFGEGASNFGLGAGRDKAARASLVGVCGAFRQG